MRRWRYQRERPRFPTPMRHGSRGAPAPVKQYSVAAGVVLGPAKKLVSITSLTRELAEACDFEAIIDTILREAVSYILDSSVFSNTAASAARPAGILVGISPLSATAAGVAPDV